MMESDKLRFGSVEGRENWEEWREEKVTNLPFCCITREFQSLRARDFGVAMIYDESKSLWIKLVDHISLSTQ